MDDRYQVRLVSDRSAFLRAKTGDCSQSLRGPAHQQLLLAGANKKGAKRFMECPRMHRIDTVRVFLWWEVVDISFGILRRGEPAGLILNLKSTRIRTH